MSEAEEDDRSETAANPLVDVEEWPLDDVDGDDVRECDSCQNSLDRLECHVPETARRTFQM